MQDGDDGKIVYLFLPYYKNGTLQHVINKNAVNGTRYPELSALLAFHGTCLAVQALHTGRSGAAATASTTPHGLAAREEYPPQLAPAGSSTANISPRDGGLRAHHEGGEGDDDEEGLGLPEGEGEDELLIAGGSTQAALEEAAGLPEGGLEMGRLNPREGKKVVDGARRWAHRDIKPANIMLADDGTTPILMDFGSAAPARIPVPTRQAALTQQDLAAEMCSMPFRAPELFDVKTGVDLTEAVDIWSLGATLYAVAYGYSPFETPQQAGSSVMMAVLNRALKFPNPDPHYSQSFRDLIDGLLVVDPAQRPDIVQVIERVEAAIARLQ